MVGGEAHTDRVDAVVSGVGKKLEDYYATHMTKMPLFLRRRSEKRLSLEACQDIAQEASSTSHGGSSPVNWTKTSISWRI
ncbi:hypothetical protein Stube_68980 [Streptomyces tubercidicus]|uniref:Uncharacterized protein n=1 Tax=Streptomyces tubercidicus TaxID=47759 RepID=A0A640V5N3_9ACTN|nr:hypothetical protein Stube_68980 [Streptomyces tubercidicus]